MDYYINLIWLNTEQPSRLDDFKTFVHHRGGIDRDAIAHSPVRVRERLLRRNALQRSEWRLSKRSARSRQHKAPHFAALSAAQTLVYRVVLAIHGKQFAPGFPRRSHNQLACRNQHFFV